MARVSIDDHAFKDLRFKKLARILKITSLDAIGRMLPLWSYCTENATYDIDPGVIDLIYDGMLPNPQDFEAALIEVGLVTKGACGKLHVCGTQGRVEWLKNIRENGKKGGRPKTRTKPDGIQKETRCKPESNPLSLALTLNNKQSKKNKPNLSLVSERSEAIETLAGDIETLNDLGVKITKEGVRSAGRGKDTGEISQSLQNFSFSILSAKIPRIRSSPEAYLYACIEKHGYIDPNFNQLKYESMRESLREFKKSRQY